MKRELLTFFKYLLPAIFTNICVFLFGIIDGIFVGNGVGTDGLGAINIVWPFVMVNYGFTVLTSIGGATIAAIRIGKKNYSGANEAFNNSIFLTIILSSIMMLFGTCLTNQISIMLGATSEYLHYVNDYLFWYSLFIVPSSVGTCLEHFCRNDNDPNLVLTTTIISTLVNIVLDYLLIFPIPLAVKGAAIATGIANLVRFLLVLTHYYGKKGILRITFENINKKMIQKICKRGFPEMLAQFASPVTIFWMNKELGSTIGTIGINAYAIICYVASFILSVMYGCSEGVQPLLGQAYGEGNKRELKIYFTLGIISVILGSTLLYFIVVFFTREVCLLYGTDIQTTNYTVKVLPLFSWGFIIAGVNALFSAYLYSTKRTNYSNIFNICRSFLFNSLCILIIPNLFGIDTIWIAYGVSEILVLFVGIYLIKYSERYGIQFV